MNMDVLLGILIPFLGTTLGAGCVFLIKDNLSIKTEKFLLGFASGVMVAASIWSLIMPSIDMSENSGKYGSLVFIPAAVGFAVGILFLLLMDKIVPHLHVGSTEPEGKKTKLQRTTMLVLAVTLHNIPEGMAVGVVFAGVLSGNALITLSGAYALAIGIAIQNFPEGAIISLPLKSEAGVGKKKAFGLGVVSGVVEPIAAIITILITTLIEGALPYLLSFAAGAMIYVVVEELIPEASEGSHSNIPTLAFAVGFLVMMILDVWLG